LGGKNMTFNFTHNKLINQFVEISRDERLEKALNNH
jgi:hypothetical protein